MMKLEKSENLLNLVICIDDTDNMESIGTGELLEIMGKELAQRGLGKMSYITRHQLFVHEDIPYTSHNSAMCSELEIEEEDYPRVMSFAMAFLRDNAAEGSDPGLCLIRRDALSEANKEVLISFGQEAKKTILTKEAAYLLAESLKNVLHLSEHGGTGQGVIGALAGSGLHLSGNDGRIKGKIYTENPGNLMMVEHLVRRYPFDEVRLISGEVLMPEDKVKIGEELKGVYLDHKVILLVKRVEKDLYQPFNKKELKAY